MTYRLFRRKRNILYAILGLLIVAIIIVRIYLSAWLLDYVNNVLNNIDGYKGSVEGISVHLYRGAYEIDGLKIYKKNGNIPTPFVDIAKIDLSLQWGALIHGRIVSDVELDKPIINFAINKNDTVKQTGKGVDWNKPIRDLMPIDINVVTFNDGKLSYQDFSASPKVNLYIHHMDGELRNLRNVVDKTKPLPSQMSIHGDSIGGGKLAMRANMNILKPVPDMDLDLKLENANLTAFSNFTNAYGAIDIKSGKLSVYSELAIKNSHVSGYVKPIATDISLIDLRKAGNPFKLAWDTAVAVVVEVFTNHSTGQFATKVPLEGDLGKGGISTDTWAAIGGILHNAFIEAMKKGVDGSVKF